MKAKEICYVGLMVALITICSWISIPMTVPFTLQTFAVFVTVGVLGMKGGAMAVLTYMLLGAIGLPVFAGFSGGLGQLLGNTGGYIIGFFFSALVTGLVMKYFGKRPVVLVVGFAIGLLVCYIFGTAWFIYFYSNAKGAIGLATALSWCVTPFIIPDAIKIGLAVLVVKRVEKSVAL